MQLGEIQGVVCVCKVQYRVASSRLQRFIHKSNTGQTKGVGFSDG
jgi:hypothetical protein